MITLAKLIQKFNPMQGYFIVIEGLDGSGKSTQLEMLTNEYNKAGHKTCFIHFPRTNQAASPFFGDLIARFLRGEFGKADQVDPYLVAMLFAGDRFNEAAIIRDKLNNGYNVLADRYVLSNIAFQCAKLESDKAKNQLMNWIKDLEFNYFGIPKPDASIFLRVPFSFVEANLQNSRLGNDRDYLNGAADIHEADLSFQQKVFDMYMMMAKTEDLGLTLIDCRDENQNMCASQVTSQRIIDFLKSKNFL